MIAYALPDSVRTACDFLVIGAPDLAGRVAGMPRVIAPESVHVVDTVDIATLATRRTVRVGGRQVRGDILGKRTLYAFFGGPDFNPPLTDMPGWLAGLVQQHAPKEG